VDQCGQVSASKGTRAWQRGQWKIFIDGLRGAAAPRQRQHVCLVSGARVHLLPEEW